MARELIKSFLSKSGYTLVRNPGWQAGNLRKPGFNPKTVFDVGAAFGTPQLYRAFPDACHVLIEPLKEYQPYLRRTLAKYTGYYLPCAAGAQRGRLEIHVEPEHLMKSSFHERTALTATNCELECREVEIRTLDDIQHELDCEPPFGVKINAGGFEYQVIQGAQELLRSCQFVIAEISVAQRFTNSSGFADFVRIMHENRFRLCDVLDAPRRNAEIVLVNAVFKPCDS